MKLRGNKTPVFSCIQPLGTPQTGYIIKARGHPEKHRQERRLRHRRTESGESGAGEADRRAEGAVPPLSRTERRGKGSGADTEVCLQYFAGGKPQRAAYAQARP